MRVNIDKRIKIYCLFLVKNQFNCEPSSHKDKQNEITYSQVSNETGGITNDYTYF